MTRVSFGKIVVLLAGMWLGTAALAADEPTGGTPGCAPLLTLPARLPDPALRIDKIHRGLRSMLNNWSAALSDNRLGPYTRQALHELCLSVPLDPGVDVVAGTLALAQDYGEVAEVHELWRSYATDPRLAPRLTAVAAGSSVTLLPLRLAGPPALAKGALMEGGFGPTCPQVDPGTLPADAKEGLAALTRAGAGLWPNLSSLCPALTPAAGGNASVAATLAVYGGIERALPGALADLLSPDFAAWLTRDQDDRVPRLMGTDAAVLALLRDYRAAGAAPPPQAAVAPADPGPPTVTALDYFAIETADFDAIKRALTADLDLGCLEGQGFATAAALKAAVMTAARASLLGGEGGCAPKPEATPEAKAAAEAEETPPDPRIAPVTDRMLARIGAALDSNPQLMGHAFTLDDAKLNGLLLVPVTAPSAAALGKLRGIVAATRAELEAAVEATIRATTRDEIEVQVAAAASAVAGAAEPVDPGFDTRPAGVPEFPDLPTPPAIGVTEATDGVMTVMVQDKEFWTALMQHEFAPASTPDVLKADVRRVLEPIAAAKVEKTVAAAMAAVAERGVVTESWTVTPDLVAAVAAAASIGSDGLLRETLARLVGLPYPFLPLFESALDAALAEGAAAAAEVPAPADRQAIRELVLSLARQRVVPGALSDASRIAATDCGCISEREDNAQVYAFFPFWRLDGQDRSFGRQAVSAVNFRLVDRIALYGLELSDRLPAGANDWLDRVGAPLVRAAHIHRAKADYAITLAGWQDWSADRVARAVSEIARMVAPVPGAGRFGTTRPDGVTLIFPGYHDSHRTTTPDAGGIHRCRPAEPCWTILSLVEGLSRQLQPQGQTINIALDLAIDEAAADETGERPALLDELCSILADPADCHRADPDHTTPVDPRSDAGQALSYPLVDRVLVFLPRPTSDSKKFLRYGLDWGIFHGEARENVLRRILPVVPPLEEMSSAPVQARELETLTTDLVYYQDNFGGVAFWPAPDPAAPTEAALWGAFAGQPAGGEAGGPVTRGSDWMTENWVFAWVPGAPAARGLCVLICPNRGSLGLAAGLIAGFVLLLVAGSFVSGLAPGVRLRRGLVAVGTVALLAILAGLSVCDPLAVVAPVVLVGLMLGIFAGAVLTAWQVARNGPMP
ncbi:hypothetical protein SAMN05878503_10832 [Cereibacter ovatus]|uniref:Uncharacterized protein n=1 Tax=Cereibacter ovatus TaxID=439529 RepID=A0A285CU26_9RHOB|nr:hypothetical protein [Cereibacter ovatus]SNX71079.1 hypothetical protein SAMN05878503_10832 [Cereibacter ovatus]